MFSANHFSILNGDVQLTNTAIPSSVDAMDKHVSCTDEYHKDADDSEEGNEVLWLIHCFLSRKEWQLLRFLHAL